MAKTSVQFYYEYMEQLEDLDDKQFRNVVLAMVKYDEEDELIELDKVSKMAFNFIKKRIDYDKEKYELICERNRENGSKGGRPKENPEEPKKPSGLSGNPKNPEEPKKPDIDIELDLDIDKDIDIYNNITTTTNNNNNTIYDYLEQNFGRTLSPSEYEEVVKWEDNELTRYAIKTAVLNGVCKIRYINSILNNYRMNNITTVQQAQMAEEEFNKNKNKPRSYGKYQSMDEFNAVLERNKDEEE